MTEQQISPEEQQVVRAVENQCMIAISNYLNQLANALDEHNLPPVNSTDLRAMAAQVEERRANEYGEI